MSHGFGVPFKYRRFVIEYVESSTDFTQCVSSFAATCEDCGAKAYARIEWRSLTGAIDELVIIDGFCRAGKPLKSHACRVEIKNPTGSDPIGGG